MNEFLQLILEALKENSIKKEKLSYDENLDLNLINFIPYQEIKEKGNNHELQNITNS